MSYTKTTWVDDITPVSANNMNKIELGINDAHLHMEDTDNPHGVTTGKIGAETPAGAQAKVNTHANEADPHTQYALDADMNAHVGAGGTAHAVATTSTNGFMSSTDKSKLNGVETGATADQTAAEILVALKTVDTDTSGLNSNTLQGKTAAAFALAENEFYIASPHIYTNSKTNITTGQTFSYTASINLGDIAKVNGLDLAFTFEAKETAYNNWNRDSYLRGLFFNTGGVLRCVKALKMDAIEPTTTYLTLRVDSFDEDVTLTDYTTFAGRPSNFGINVTNVYISGNYLKVDYNVFCDSSTYSGKNSFNITIKVQQF